MLTGWAFAHLVNLFAHQVNQTSPLPQIAHPVNYVAHRKKKNGITIIKNRQFRLVFAKLTNLFCWKTSGNFCEVRMQL